MTTDLAAAIARMRALQAEQATRALTEAEFQEALALMAVFYAEASTPAKAREIVARLEAPVVQEELVW